MAENGDISKAKLVRLKRWYFLAPFMTSENRPTNKQYKYEIPHRRQLNIIHMC